VPFLSPCRSSARQPLEVRFWNSALLCFANRLIWGWSCADIPPPSPDTPWL
jgi:hypothetical protein